MKKMAVLIFISFLLFHQTKYAIAGTSLAPVGGHIEPNETPFQAAQRELEEEMGCVADRWIYFGGFRGNGNHGGGIGHLFLALEAKIVTEPNRDDLEEMELIEMSVEELERQLFNAQIKVQGWIAVIAMSLLYLKNMNAPEKK